MIKFKLSILKNPKLYQEQYKLKTILISITYFFLILICSLPCNASQNDLATKNYDPIPANIIWHTNTKDPVFSSPQAQKGGTLRFALSSFPITFRTVGPDSNGAFRSAILDNQLSLINIHPNTRNIIPELATHWAFDADGKTMYFKLDKEAKWSNGKPVTAWDYKYTLKFMRSPHIIAPWYNDYYKKKIEKILIFDDYTIGIKSTRAVPDLHFQLSISPTPEHFFYPLNSQFIQKMNWAIVPNTGAYQISEFKKGRFIRFERKKNWWGKNKKYFTNRFNVDSVIFTVIRDQNLQWTYFKKGYLDIFGLTAPKYWHKKGKDPIFTKGFVHRIQFFNDLPRPSYGIWLNQDKPIFKDIRLRKAFAHGMNINKVIKRVLRNDYYRLNQAFSGYKAYTDNNIFARPYDRKKVNQIMESLGWKRGKDGIWQNKGQRFSITITYGYEDHMPQLVVLKEEARKAGIELLLERLDPSAMFKKFLEKNHEAAWMGWGTSLRPSYWEGWHSDNAHKSQTNNITNTDDPVLDKLIEKYRISLDTNERITLSKKIQKQIHEICSFVPTYMIPYIRSAYWNWIQLPDFHGTSMTDNLFDPFSATTGGLLWIDQKLFSKTYEKRTVSPAKTIVNKKYIPKDLQ